MLPISKNNHKKIKSQTKLLKLFQSNESCKYNESYNVNESTSNEESYNTGELSELIELICSSNSDGQPFKNNPDLFYISEYVPNTEVKSQQQVGNKIIQSSQISSSIHPNKNIQNDDANYISQKECILYQIDNPSENIHNYPIITDGNKLYISMQTNLLTKQNSPNIFETASSVDANVSTVSTIQNKRSDENKHENIIDDTLPNCSTELGWDCLNIEI